MTKKNILKIIIIILIVLIAILIIRKIINKPSETNENGYIKPDFVDHSEDVISTLTEAENKYTRNTDIYTRYDFYNSTSLNFEAVDSYVDFVVLTDISVDAQYYYDGEGNEISGIPSPEVDITTYTEMEVGNYYLVRFYATDEIYVYYYITQLTDSGFESVELFLITEGEQVRDYRSRGRNRTIRERGVKSYPQFMWITCLKFNKKAEINEEFKWSNK